MATLKTNIQLDLMDYSSGRPGEITYADRRVIVVEGDDTYSTYFGLFKYDEENISGTVKAVEVYDWFSDDLLYETRGFNIDVENIFFGASVERTIKKVFSGDDRLYGSSYSDTLAGFSGDDKLFGKDGNDRLLGVAGKDKISGAAGNDILKGGSGKDTLIGGEGSDKLTGDSERDFFVFNSKSDRDTIAAFF